MHVTPIQVPEHGLPPFTQPRAASLSVSSVVNHLPMLYNKAPCALLESWAVANRADRHNSQRQLSCRAAPSLLPAGLRAMGPCVALLTLSYLYLCVLCIELGARHSELFACKLQTTKPSAICRVRQGTAALNASLNSSSTKHTKCISTICAACFRHH